jgi:hypothetical protein
LSIKTLVAIAFAAGALAACDGSAATPPVYAQALPLAQRDSHGPLVYVADSRGNFVDIFRRDGKLAGRIVAGLDAPEDLYVDGNHNLWVANNGGRDVLEFPRGAMKASAIYRGVTDPWDATTCATTLYVTAGGGIAVFPPHHHSPTGYLSSNYGMDISVACDAAGNLFATGTVASPPGYVFEFPAGSTKAKLLPIDLPNPDDAKPDPAGNLLVLDSAGDDYNTVTEYTESGSPTGRSMPTEANWNEMAITPSGDAVFGADETNLEGSLRAFPSGKQLQTYTDAKFEQLGGIAYDPG